MIVPDFYAVSELKFKCFQLDLKYVLANIHPLVR
jgi:hypothetical protein